MVIKIFVVILLISIVIFIAIAIGKMKMVRKPNYSFGNGQYIGEMEHQNDYFTITQISEFECLLTIADGTSLRENIRQSAIMANNIIKEIYIKNRNLHSFKDLLEYSFLEIEEKNKRIVFENRIGLSILSVQVRRDLLAYGQIGTCVLLLYRNNIITNIVESDYDKQKFGELRLKAKDKIVLLTKGAFNSLTEMEIINELSTNKETNDKAITLMNIVKSKRYKHQENATVVILEIESIL